MGRYRVIGKANIPHSVLTDHAVGDEIDAELDKDEERLLLDIGALEKLPARKAAAKPAAKSTSKEAK